jgi:hypothetical protein
VSDTTERRNRTRYNANCQCWIEQDSITLLGTVTNLSEKGFFLQTLPIIECGAQIDIRMNLQDLGDLYAKGRICWKSDIGGAPAEAAFEEKGNGEKRRDSNPPGMGIEFDHVTEGKELLLKYFETNSLIPEPDTSV